MALGAPEGMAQKTPRLLAEVASTPGFADKTRTLREIFTAQYLAVLQGAPFHLSAEQAAAEVAAEVAAHGRVDQRVREHLFVDVQGESFHAGTRSQTNWRRNTTCSRKCRRTSWGWSLKWISMNADYNLRR